MEIRTLLLLASILVLLFQGFFNPILLGDEREKQKRVPIITIALVAINILVFAVTLLPLEKQDSALLDAKIRLLSFLEEDPSYLNLDDVQKRLTDAELAIDGKLIAVNHFYKIEPGNDLAARRYLGDNKIEQFFIRFDDLMKSYKSAMDSHILFQYGIAPNGRWKYYQLLTAMFLHGGLLHLVGNLIFLVAISLSLEMLWGRSIFFAFYILVGLAASIPALMVPFNGPAMGASGAISGLMGAYLVSLHKTRLKIGWLSTCFPVFLLFRKRPFGIKRVPAYIFLPYYFISQMLLWWFFKERGMVSGTAYSVHVGGFFFGALFAVALESINLKTNFFSMKFSESAVGAEVRELVALGHLNPARDKVKLFLSKKPDDLEAMIMLAEIYALTRSYGEMNAAYSGIIRRCLSRRDKQAALNAYDSLLSAFPEDQIAPRIPPNDWMTICDYIYKSGMVQEAAVEYDRLASLSNNGSLTLRACVQGGEAALAVKDAERAIRLFEKALSMRPTEAYESRVRRGLERCSSHQIRT